MVGLVSYKVGTWREVMEMDFEDAINTFKILYINSLNEALEYEELNKKSK
ncbi:TPA: hypothetical protein R5B02_001629 [Campylobacter jejuni]|nr:hypothetical protein [Campylobacter jejuni]